MPGSTPSHPPQFAVITYMSPLCNLYIIQYYLTYPQPDLEHHRPHPNKYNHMQATLLSITLTQAYTHYTCPPKFSLSLTSIVTVLYLVPFLICTSLFPSWHYRFPVPALYLSFYLLWLVVWSLDSRFTHLLSWTHHLMSHSLLVFKSLVLGPQKERRQNWTRLQLWSKPLVIGLVVIAWILRNLKDRSKTGCNWSFRGPVWGIIWWAILAHSHALAILE